MNENEERDEALFDAALKLPANERAAFLSEACSSDEDLRHRVEVLLDAYERSGGFMEEPAATRVSAGANSPEDSPPPTEMPGDRIGRYKLLKEIGEGGCGVVYLAEQEEPFRRQVALKVIKLGMDTRQVIARFNAERQALALMDHPHIARVLDAGATEAGRPYFVMELVHGTRITDYCDWNELTPKARLELFIQVCQAVQHAHQKGVIHRDLKPSNILITLVDDEPVPKVIDFGIAKATQGQRLADQTMFTAFEQFIGTPAYMSPEQTSHQVDTRSDVYSLGVLLYELLTGRPPFEEDDLLRRGMEEMLRVLREEEPPRPSTRLGKLEATALLLTAKQRQTDPPRLIHAVRGDLDWIVMKCLEKDRTRRYETANGLAIDIQHHLAKRPIAARPPGALYLVKKFVARNRAACAMAAASILILVAVAVGSMEFSRRIWVAEHNGRERLQKPPGDEGTPIPVSTPSLPQAVSGVVRSAETGEPLHDALVIVAAPARDLKRVKRGGIGLREVRTDSEGRFTCEVPSGNTVALDVQMPGYESVAGPIKSQSRFDLRSIPAFAGNLQNLTVDLRRTLYIAGRISDENGQPIPSATIEATEHEPGSMSYIKQIESDSLGRFEIFDFPLKAPPNSRGQLVFDHPMMLRSMIRDVYALGETDQKNLRIILKRGHDVYGELTSAGGKPVANTLVEALPAAQDSQFKQAITDAEGRFQLQGLPDGKVIIRSHALALEQKTRSAVRIDGADMEVNLRLEPVVSGKPLSVSTLFGMKLVDLTPDLSSAYELADNARGVLVVAIGEGPQRAGLEGLQPGEYFWFIGYKPIENVPEMVAEMLRVNELPPHTDGTVGEGHRGLVRVVYSNHHRTMTTYVSLNQADATELKSLLAQLGKP